MMVGLMYEDPFYDLNYVYAGLLALVYLDLYEADPAAFAQKYAALMRNGFDAPPRDLLRSFLGIDLADTEGLTARAVNVLRKRIERY